MELDINLFINYYGHKIGMSEMLTDDSYKLV